MSDHIRIITSAKMGGSYHELNLISVNITLPITCKDIISTERTIPPTCKNTTSEKIVVSTIIIM